MSLHPDLNNIRVIFSEVLSAEFAARQLDLARAKTEVPLKKLMYEAARDEMKKELNYKLLLLRNTLNNHYAKHNTFLWVNPNDPSKD